MDEGSSASLSSGGGSSIESASSSPGTPPRKLSSAPSLLTLVLSPNSSSLSSSPPSLLNSSSPPSIPALERISDLRPAEEPAHEPRHDTSYDARTINFITEASLGRYKLRRSNGTRFLISTEASDSTNKFIAFIPAIDIGAQYSCVADYFNGKPSLNSSKSASSSPMSPGSNIRRPCDLWQELKPFFSANELLIKIFYPYAHVHSWVIGEITINKNANQFRVDITIYDPLNIAGLEPLDHAGIKEHVIQEIKKINNSAYIETRGREKRCTMLSPDETAASGVMAIEILLSLASNSDLQQLTSISHQDHRNQQLKSVLKHYDKEHPYRKKFISTFARPAAQSARNPSNANAEIRLIIYGSGENKYLPDITEAQDQYFLQCAKSIEIRKINNRAAFEAAKTGNVMLLQALLGLEHDEDIINEQLETLAKESYALKQNMTEMRFKIAVIQMQTELIGDYLDSSEVARNPEILKQQITSKIEHIAKEIVEDFIADYFARKRGEEVMINMRYIKMDELSHEELSAHKSAFCARLLTYKTTFETEFSQHELDTIHKTLKQMHFMLIKSFEEIQKVITTKDTEYAELTNLLVKDVITHRKNAGRFWKLRRDTLPDFFPRDEVGFWSHVLFARVPIHQRDESTFGNTLLHVAWLHGHKNVARLLLARGIDPDIKNHQGRTPYELRNEPKHKLLALSQQALLLINQESEFVRRVRELRASYLAELSSQENASGIFGGLIKKFVDTDLLAERKRTLEKLGTFIELAIAECNDADLARWIYELLKAHFNGKFVHLKDALPINGTDFFQKLATVYNGILSTRREDFNAIRLPSNFEKFLLERSVSTQNSKLLEAQAKLAITSEENHRLRMERDEARQQLDEKTKKLELEKKLRIEIERRLEEERRKTAEDLRIVEQKLKENDDLRRIAAASSELTLTSHRQRSGSMPAAVAASSPKAPSVGGNPHILLSSSSVAAHAKQLPQSSVGVNSIQLEMHALSKGAGSGKSHQASK